MRFMSGPSKKTGEVITAIKELRNGKMAVAFGCKKLTLSKNVYSEYPLYVGKTVVPLELRDLLALTKSESLYEYGLSLAAKGCYSSHEVKAKLVKKAQPGQDPREILFRLKQAGFLDDESFATQYKEEKERQLYGKERILGELRYKKCLNEAILAKLVFLEEAANAKRAVSEMERKYARLPLKAKKAKLVNALLRRGYGSGEATAAVAALKGNPSEENRSLKLLCQKTIERYGRKYKGYDLKAHCYGYLVAKGYDRSAVGALLEEML